MKRSHVFLLLVGLALAACDTLTGNDEDDACAQTFEFGNFGCAVLVVHPGDLPESAPDSYRWKISAEGEETRFEFIEAGQNPIPRRVEGRVTLWQQLPEEVDTTTVPVVLEIRDDTGPIETGTPVPLFAVDSIEHTIRFAEVGERPRVDTLTFELERVDGE